MTQQNSRCKQAFPVIPQRTGATDKRERRNEKRRKRDVSEGKKEEVD
jgi:hypothetical protein